MQPRILLRSSWQTVNIGDIGHTPGALRLFERHLPGAEITLWPSKVDRGVREQLIAAWPKLRIVEGDMDADGRPTTPDLADAFSRCDVLVHGSGPNLMAKPHLEAWRKTGKPYGFFGITADPTAFGAGGDWEGGTLDKLRTHLAALPLESISEEDRSLFSSASFVFLRDTLSLEFLQRQIPGLGSRAAFGPDATFACDLRDDDRATGWLKARGLEDKKFICVLPRLRWTPYHLIHVRPPTDSDNIKDSVNARTRSADHAALREMIIRWVRQTGLKVLACPEMTYQVTLAKTELIDPLPDDVKPSVVWRDSYWLNDEATSVYARAHSIISLENHSPILALAQGTPVIFLRNPTDTIKGQMWPDVGLGEDFFEVEQATGDALWKRLALIHSDYPAAQARVRQLTGRIAELQSGMVAAVTDSLPR